MAVNHSTREFVRLVPHEFPFWAGKLGEMQLPEQQHQCTIDLRGWNIVFDYSSQILRSRIF
jgi:hypothetical protein